MRPISFRILAFLFLLFLAAGSAISASPPLAGRLVRLEGEVSVRRAGSDQWEAAKRNQELLEGDMVRTGPASGAAILLYPDEKRIQLRASKILLVEPRIPLPERTPAEASGEEKLPSRPSGCLLSFKGQVEVRRAGSDKWMSGEETLYLFPGDTVRTGKASRAVLIIFHDRSRYEGRGPHDKALVGDIHRLEENSQMILPELTDPPRLYRYNLPPPGATPRG